MNLTTAEALVHRIGEALEAPAADPQAARWAQEYADLCRTVNHRLDQCAAMLNAGETAQALELAETPPAVLDLVTLLGFRETHRWRAFCQSHGLPVAESLNGRAIQQLNAVYAQGPSHHDPRYRDYRAAVLRRDDGAALAILREILAACPDDTNAQREAARIERKILDERLSRLRRLLATGPPEAVIAEIEAIESLRFQSRPDGEAWIEAQQLRCRSILARFEALQARGAWEEAEPVLAEFEQWSARYGLAWPDAQQAALAAGRAWIGRQRQAHADAARCREELTELQRLMDEIDRHQLATRPSSLAALRRDLEALQRRRLAVEQFGRSLPADLEQRLANQTRSLQTQIFRRVRSRRTLLVLGAVGLAIAALFLGQRWQTQRRIGDLAAELGQFVTNREVLAAQRLLGYIAQIGARQTNDPALTARVTLAAAFVTRELVRKEGFDRLLGELTNQVAALPPGAPLDDLQGRWDQVCRLTNELAPDFLAPAQAALLAYQTRWNSLLAASAQTELAAFERALEEAQALAAQLDYAAGAQAVRSLLARLEPLGNRMARQMTSPIPQLRPTAALRDRFGSVTQRVDAYADQVRRWETVQATLARPVDAGAYGEALRQLQRSEFAEPAAKATAAVVASLATDATNLWQRLVLPGVPADWARWLGAPAVSLLPADVLPAERTTYVALRDDEIIHGTRVARLTDPGRIAFDPLQIRTGYVRGEITTNRERRRIALVHDPARSPQALDFQPQQLQSLELEVTVLGRTPEAAVFERAGLKELLDNNTGKYRVSLLRVLDDLNLETKASPLFVAFIEMRLFDLMLIQPWAWGLPWAPAAQAHYQRLVQLGADRLRSGDWMLQPLVQARAPALIEQFERARRVRFEKQAIWLHRLARLAWTDGFVFAGYIDATGQPRLSELAAAQTALWGWRAADRSPARLLRRDAGSARWVPVQPALPWTPLFAFAGDRSETLRLSLAEADLAPADPAVAEYLPPLFATDHE